MTPRVGEFSRVGFRIIVIAYFVSRVPGKYLRLYQILLLSSDVVGPSAQMEKLIYIKKKSNLYV